VEIAVSGQTITCVTRGEFTGRRPEFDVAFGTSGAYVAVEYECRFTYDNGQWDTRAVTVVGAAKKGDGSVGRRTRSVHFIVSAEGTPDWVPSLIERVRATITF
jgi:hypothetical protein